MWVSLLISVVTDVQHIAIAAPVKCEQQNVHQMLSKSLTIMLQCWARRFEPFVANSIIPVQNVRTRKALLDLFNMSCVRSVKLAEKNDYIADFIFSSFFSLMSVGESEVITAPIQELQEMMRREMRAVGTYVMKDEKKNHVCLEYPVIEVGNKTRICYLRSGNSSVKRRRNSY